MSSGPNSVPRTWIRNFMGDAAAYQRGLRPQSLYGIYGNQQQAGVQQLPQSTQNFYDLHGMQTQGMYTPNESIVRNAMRLGMRNPFQSLGYGAAPTYNRYVPPPPVVQAAPVAQPEETYQPPQL